MQGVTGSSPVSPTISLPRTAQPAEGPSPCRRCAGRTIIAAIPQGVDAGMTLLELARKEGKAKVAVAARVDGAVVDLARPLPDGAKVDWVLPSDPDGAEILRHITAHAMAVRREEVAKEQARALFPGEPYKEELLADIPDATVSLYRMGNFLDLCRGPHVPATGRLGAFHLMSTAGAYWRGDSKNRMLTRIYGAAFPTKKELEEHLRILEEIKKRDHRKLGRELDLFSVTDDIGPGLILWHPKGAIVRRVMEDFWRDEHAKAGYELVFSPHIARLDLWRISGHTDFYRQAMFSPLDIEGQEYKLKTMKCH